jgi:NAD(P)-dependent dehydrogenase (short-subunit alcohol dehydrogenase family)
MNDLFSVRGKVAVVTGGSGGIGGMIAEGLVKNGVKTYITARNEERLNAAVAELSKHGECVGISSNLGTIAGVELFSTNFSQQEDKLDILVNNAGTAWGADIDSFPENGWDKVMDLNLKSMFFLTQKLLPLLRKAGTFNDPARVLNIGSINGITHTRSQNYSYTASKAAVHHLTKHLGADLAGDFVNINSIAPGVFPSKMTAKMLQEEAEVVAAIPRGRMGTPEDAAGAAIFLCSRASAWVTGHTLVLDGGQVAAA